MPALRDPQPNRPNTLHSLPHSDVEPPKFSLLHALTQLQMLCCLPFVYMLLLFTGAWAFSLTFDATLAFIGMSIRVAQLVPRKSWSIDLCGPIYESNGRSYCYFALVTIPSRNFRRLYIIIPVICQVIYHLYVSCKMVSFICILALIPYLCICGGT